jgi:urease subunit alpha
VIEVADPARHAEALKEFVKNFHKSQNPLFQYGTADLVGLAKKLGIDKKLYAVENTRGGISKKSMIHNSATPKIEVDPETYEVRADGELLACAPAEVLPMAQRYFMF